MIDLYIEISSSEVKVRFSDLSSYKSPILSISAKSL